MNYCRVLKTLPLIFAFYVSLNGQTAGFVNKVEDTVIVVDESHFQLVIAFEVASGFHIQSSNPENENVIPTRINLQLPNTYKPTAAIFPEAKAKYLEGSEEPLQVLGGYFEVIIGLERGGQKSSLSDPHQVPGTLFYQACDDKRCFYPRELDFIVDLAAL